MVCITLSNPLAEEAQETLFVPSRFLVPAKMVLPARSVAAKFCRLTGYRYNIVSAQPLALIVCDDRLPTLVAEEQATSALRPAILRAMSVH
jgi:hypothetical protein